MVDRSHLESEVKSDSINRKAITNLVGKDTLSLFLRCLVPKLKQVKTFDPLDMPGGHFEFSVKSASTTRMAIPNIVGNHILSVVLCCLVPKLCMFVHWTNRHTHIGHVASAGGHVESEVKSDSGRLMGIPDIVGNDTFSVSLLYLVAKLGIFVH